MNLRTLPLVAGWALGSFASLASAVALDISSGSAGFVNTPPAGAFSDIYTFTLPVATTLTGVVASVENGGQDVDFTSITLTGPSGPQVFTMINTDLFEVWAVNTPSLTAGVYTLTLVGTNSPGIGTYTGNLAVAAIPEAETYVMMLAGPGIVGYLTLRSRRG